jgi:arsenical pump membrane protein
MLVAVAVFIFTLTLVIWQPRGLGVGWSATLGAIIALAVGAVSLQDIPVVWAIVWNATATFIAIIIISPAGRGGFLRVGGPACGALGGAVSSPVRLLHPAWRCRFGVVRQRWCGADPHPHRHVDADRAALFPATTLAFVMAAGFIADTASLPLVVSNLVNIVSADYFGLGFADYAAVMVPVNLASIGATLLVLWLFFRRDLPQRYPADTLPAPSSAIRDPATFAVGGATLLLLLVGLFALEPLGIPVSVVAGVCAALLFAVAARGHRISTRRVLREAPWQVVIFSLGMYLVVYGLKNAGLTDLLARLLDQLAAHGLWSATLGTGLLAALLSSVMNNLPSVLVGALSIQASGAEGLVREAMIYANVIGCDLGPKITPIGSLATLLWLHVLARKGMRISWGYYFKVGLVLTLPVLLITLSALALRLSL